MNHYIYKIIDTKTNSYYIGMRSCDADPIEDAYMGSGNWIKNHRKEYGHLLQKSNGRFIKEIIEYCGSRKELELREEIIIGDLWYNDPQCMNEKVGGISSAIGENHNNYNKTKYHLWDHLNQKELFMTPYEFEKEFNKSLYDLLTGKCKSASHISLYENKDKEYGKCVKERHFRYDPTIYHLWDHKNKIEIHITKNEFKKIYKMPLSYLTNGQRDSIKSICLYENRFKPYGSSRKSI